jgi:hypothetical protein
MKRLLPRKDVLVGQTGGVDGALALISFDGNAPTSVSPPLGSGAFKDLVPCSLGQTITTILLFDFDGDGRTDVAQLDATAQQVIIARAAIAPLSDRYGHSCPGTMGLPHIGPDLAPGANPSLPREGMVYTLELTNALPGGTALLLVGTPDSVTVFDPGTSSTCDLNLAPEISIFLTLPVGFASSDPAAINLPILIPIGLQGLELGFCWIFSDPMGAFAGFAATEGLRVRVGP